MSEQIDIKGIKKPTEFQQFLEAAKNRSVKALSIGLALIGSPFINVSPALATRDAVIIENTSNPNAGIIKPDLLMHRQAIEKRSFDLKNQVLGLPSRSVVMVSNKVDNTGTEYMSTGSGEVIFLEKAGDYSKMVVLGAGHVLLSNAEQSRNDGKGAQIHRLKGLKQLVDTSRDRDYRHGLVGQKINVSEVPLYGVVFGDIGFAGTRENLKAFFKPNLEKQLPTKYEAMLMITKAIQTNSPFIGTTPRVTPGISADTGIPRDSFGYGPAYQVLAVPLGTGMERPNVTEELKKLTFFHDSNIPRSIPVVIRLNSDDYPDDFGKPANRLSAGASGSVFRSGPNAAGKTLYLTLSGGRGYSPETLAEAKLKTPQLFRNLEAQIQNLVKPPKQEIFAQKDLIIKPGANLSTKAKDHIIGDNLKYATFLPEDNFQSMKKAVEAFKVVEPVIK